MFQKIAKHRANDASNDVHRPPLSRGGASSKVGLPLPPSTGVEALALLASVEGTLDGGTENSGTQGTKTKSHDPSVQRLVASQGRCVATQEELLVNIS